MVFSQLPQPPVAQQIHSAIAHVADNIPAAGKYKQICCAPHSFIAGMLDDMLEYPLICHLEHMLNEIRNSVFRWQSRFRKCDPHCIDEILTSDFTCRRATHAVCEC